MTNVIFKCNATTKLGESVLLVGSSDWLGNWNPDCGIQLETDIDIYPIWTTKTVEVPSKSKYEFKFVLKTKEFVWEDTPNRCVELAAGHENVSIRYSGTFNDPTGIETEVYPDPTSSTPPDQQEAQERTEPREKYSAGDEECRVKFADECNTHSSIARHIGLRAIFKSDSIVMLSGETSCVQGSRDCDDEFSEGGMDLCDTASDLDELECGIACRDHGVGEECTGIMLSSDDHGPVTDGDHCPYELVSECSQLEKSEFSQMEKAELRMLKSVFSHMDKSDKSDCSGRSACSKQSPNRRRCKRGSISWYDHGEEGVSDGSHHTVLSNNSRKSNSSRRSNVSGRSTGSRMTNGSRSSARRDCSKGITWYHRGSSEGATVATKFEQNSVYGGIGACTEPRIEGGIGVGVEGGNITPRCTPRGSMEGVKITTPYYLSTSDWEEAGRIETAIDRDALLRTCTPEAEVIIFPTDYISVNSSTSRGQLHASGASKFGQSTGVPDMNHQDTVEQMLAAAMEDINQDNDAKAEAKAERKPHDTKANDNTNPTISYSVSQTDTISQSISESSNPKHPDSVPLITDGKQIGICTRVVTTPSTFSYESPGDDTTITRMETPRAGGLGMNTWEENSVRDTTSPVILGSSEERLSVLEAPDDSPRQLDQSDVMKHLVDKAPHQRDRIDATHTEDVAGDWYRLHCIILYLIEFMILQYYIYKVCKDLLFLLLWRRRDQSSVDTDQGQSMRGHRVK